MHHHMYLYFHQVDRLHEPWLSGELAGIQDPTGCGNDLSSTTVDGVRVQCHVMNVKANCAHVLLTQSTLQEEDSDCNIVLRSMRVQAFKQLHSMEYHKHI